MISYRQLHVLDETYVMNGCKEDCCYVAKDFDAEMVKAKNNLVARDYVLPDFTAIRRQVTVCLTCDKPSKQLALRGFMKTAEESSGKPGEGEQLVLSCFHLRLQNLLLIKRLELDQHHFISKILKDTILISRCE